MGMISLVQADVLKWADAYTGPPFHALLCDPPYHLTGSGSGGFMGAAWDGGDVAHRPETWRALARHLHPGALLLAFASSRGFDLQSVAMRQAGLTAHPAIFGWGFGSGLPKPAHVKGHPEFAGHEYGGQVLKPALEPILVFQVPHRGRTVDGIVATGAGTYNVNAARVAADLGYHNGKGSATLAPTGVAAYNAALHGGLKATRAEPDAGGRWPANLMLCHLPDCRCVGTKQIKSDSSGTRGSGATESVFSGGFKLPVHGQHVGFAVDGMETVQAWECVPGCPVASLDAQAGPNCGAKSPVKGTEPALNSPNRAVYHGIDQSGTPKPFHGDTGSASRFFACGDWGPEVTDPDAWVQDVEDALAGADEVLYAGKASTSEREAGLHAQGYSRTRGDARENLHPCVKPLAITRRLASLLLPPACYGPRRILVPFAGVGSEVMGASLAGWEDVVGVELDSGYLDVARRRAAAHVPDAQVATAMIGAAVVGF